MSIPSAKATELAPAKTTAGRVIRDIFILSSPDHDYGNQTSFAIRLTRAAGWLSLGSPSAASPERVVEGGRATFHEMTLPA
jgi:hypothetical protein